MTGGGLMASGGRIAVSKSRPDDLDWLRRLWDERWGGEPMLSRGRASFIKDVEAWIARREGERVGALTGCLEGRVFEILTLDALVKRQGVGTGLLQHVEKDCRDRGVDTLRLVTSNDNTHALRFYQRLGYRIAALRPGAVDEARRVKPAIPKVGEGGIPIHDEIELVRPLLPRVPD